MSKTLRSRTPAQHKQFARISARQIPQLHDATLADLFGQFVGQQTCRTPSYACEPVIPQHAVLHRRGEHHV